MSTGLFSDEEDGYNIDNNLEETKYVLKGSAPSTDSSVAPTEEPFEEPMGDAPVDDLEGLEDAPAEDKPFDDEPFDAGVDADEDTDPAKYIQQLSGKLGQSLRQYSEDEGQPDFDLEKFAVNSVLSATHTGEMDKEDQRDIINQVKGAGEEDPEDMEAEPEMDAEPEVDGGEDLDFGDEAVEEIVEELPLSSDDVNEGLASWVGTGIIALSSLFGGNVSAQDVDMKSAEKVANAINKGHIDRDTIVRNYGDRIDTSFVNTYFDNNGAIKKQIEVRKIANPEWNQTSVTKSKDHLGKDYSGDVFGNIKSKIDRTYADGEKTKAKEKVKFAKDYEVGKFDNDKVNVKTTGKLEKNESVGLKESKLNRIFVDKTKLVKDLRLMENTEPMVEPKPVTKPATKPSRPLRETDRPFSPKRRTGVQPDPKAEDNDSITNEK